MTHKPIQINVGSKNKVKIQAVEEILLDYPHLEDATVHSFDVDSDVSPQPKTIEETVRGAMNRAKNAFRACDYSIGLESGFMQVPHTKSGHMDVCVCAIYDGTEFHIGLSSAWEFPKGLPVMDYILNDGMDMSQAINKAGMTNNSNVGAENGAIGILTRERMDRKAYTKQALRTALIHLETFEFDAK